MLTTLRNLFNLAIAAVAICGASAGCAPAPQQETAGTTIEPRTMPDFVLTSQDGKPLNLSALRGKPVMLAFAYTHCPDICPLTMANFKRVKAKLGDDGGRASFVMISVDGERDSPDVLKKYLSVFDDSFIGLTGAPEIVANIAAAYGAKFEKQQPAGTSGEYLVAHTSFMYLIDQAGRWRKTYAFETSVEPIAADITQLLREPPPTAGPQGEGLAAAYASLKPQPIWLESPTVLPPMNLVRSDGAPLHGNEFRGHYTLLAIASTECLDACPDVRGAFGSLKPALDKLPVQLNFALLSVDGEHDTPPVMAAYLSKQPVEILGLTGDARQTTPLVVKFGVHVERRAFANAPSGFRYVSHAVYYMLVDPDARWIVALPYSMNNDELRQAVEAAMAGRK